LPRILSILFFLAPVLWAENAVVEKRKSPLALMPEGSVFRDVLVPRYGEKRNLIGEMKVETMTLLDSTRARGENVSVRFFHDDLSPRGIVNLKNAFYYFEESRLIADEAVKIMTDRLLAHGSGLVYSFQNGEGFLRGPADTRISSPRPAPFMNVKPTIAASLLGLWLAPAPLIAHPHPDAKKESEGISKAALTFLESSGMKVDFSKQPEPKPLEISPSASDTVITCEGGMYFDADEGVLVYLKDVQVSDPRFALKGAQQLKVFFEKKEAKPEKKSSSAMGSFGDVRKIIAEGAVVIDQKSVDGKEPIQASGRELIYDIQSKEITISGGFPWVKQGTYYARAKQADLSMRILESGSFSTKGPWEVGGTLEQKKPD
jgi:lipopolysaccharide export system protein LptA